MVSLVMAEWRCSVLVVVLQLCRRRWRPKPQSQLAEVRICLRQVSKCCTLDCKDSKTYHAGLETSSELSRCFVHVGRCRTFGVAWRVREAQAGWLHARCEATPELSASPCQYTPQPVTSMLTSLPKQLYSLVVELVVLISRCMRCVVVWVGKCVASCVALREAGLPAAPTPPQMFRASSEPWKDVHELVERPACAYREDGGHGSLARAEVGAGGEGRRKCSPLCQTRGRQGPASHVSYSRSTVSM